MNFLKVEDEINYSNSMFMLRREIEDYLSNENYMYIEPSIFEGYDEFTDINNRINKKSTVKLLDNNGEILILSPDITTGIINKIMPRWEEDLKIKLFYYGKTYIHNDLGIKENRQMGVEIIGENYKQSDISTLNTAINIMNKYSCKYLFEIGSSKFLKGIMQSCIYEKEDYTTILNFLHTKNKQELKEYLLTLPYREAMSTLVNIFDLEGSFDEVTKQLKGLYINDLMEQGIEELRILNKYFKDKTNKIIYDLSMVSALNYYDGVIFKGYISGLNKEIIKGGRYDSFTEQYGYKIPSIGFSIELDELIKVVYKGGKRE